MSAMATESVLAAKIAARKKFLEKAAKFVREIAVARGEVIKRVQGSSNTHVVWRLLNFGGFSFLFDTGQTMFGGNDIKVWHHPGKPFAEGAQPTAEIHWQTDFDRCELRQFDPNPAWQGALLRLDRNKKKVAARFDYEKAETKKRAQAEEVRRREKERQEEERRRLKL